MRGAAPASAPIRPAQDSEGARGGLAWWRARGAATQAAVPGAYAWGVTVAPLGWAEGAPVVTVVAATLGLACLLVGPAVERYAPTVARAGLGWGLVVTAIATWATAPEASVDAFDAVRGISGMFGWALFAFAVASPARQAATSARQEPLPRRKSARADAAIVLVGLGLAVALQVPGWQAAPRDRALLVRLVGIAGGLGLVSAASAIAVGRDARDGKPARRQRLTLRGVLAIALVCLLMGAGLAYQVWSDR